MSHIIFKKSKITVLAAACAALFVVACGGGGGGSGSSASSNVITGLAVDGYIQGATVFLDANRNGRKDAEEPSTTTDLSGRYTLDLGATAESVVGLPVVVTGGVDSDTGLAFTGRLSASVELVGQGQVITPLTTLVDAMVSNNYAPDIATAKQKVAAALGLTVSQLTTDPVAAIASNPGIYAQSVTLQRSIQLLAAANARSNESSHETQERVVKALANAIRAQSTPVDLSQLVASLPLQNAAAAQQLASALDRSVRSGLESYGHEGAKVALKAMDEVRSRMESDGDYDVEYAADLIDRERGKTSSTPYTKLVTQGSQRAGIDLVKNNSTVPVVTRTQPANTAGRLLASNCFQCHGTGGIGGFDNIRGKEASEVREYLTQSASSSIMAAHAQGYTTAQLNAIIGYLQQ